VPVLLEGITMAIVLNGFTDTPTRIRRQSVAGSMRTTMIETVMGIEARTTETAITEVGTIGRSKNADKTISALQRFSLPVPFSGQAL